MIRAGACGERAFLERTQPYLVFDAPQRAWEIIGQLLGPCRFVAE